MVSNGSLSTYIKNYYEKTSNKRNKKINHPAYCRHFLLFNIQIYKFRHTLYFI